MFLISGSTDKGIKRPINQDSILVRKFDTPCGEMALVCVCDGMGGLQSGELASATVMYAFKEWSENELQEIVSGTLTHEAIKQSWTKIVSDCNKKILRYGENEGITLGTTLTAGLFTEKEYFIANVGDSRAYELSGKAKQLTHDHTFVQQEVDCGRMTPEEARESKQQNILTRCIGARPDILPDFYFGNTKNNSVFMFCSDGFRHKITEEEMQKGFDGAKILCEQNLKDAELSLIELNKKRLETDNISVCTVVQKKERKLLFGFLKKRKANSGFAIVEEVINTDSKNIIS